MLRRIIKIDTEKCNGCSACAKACHEGAIEMINGKAVLTREDYCDGLGDCLPACPVDAISFEVREAPAYNEAAVKEAQKAKSHSCSCPSASLRYMRNTTPDNDFGKAQPSMLAQWPCQIKLVPVNAPYFDGANLLIAADCTAFSYGSFHRDFMQNHITLIGCPKLDNTDYAEKLALIIANNNINSIKTLRMEVPCCSGLESAVKRAVQASGKNLSIETTIISTDGKILQ